MGLQGSNTWWTAVAAIVVLGSWCLTSSGVTAFVPSQPSAHQSSGVSKEAVALESEVVVLPRETTTQPPPTGRLIRISSTPPPPPTTRTLRPLSLNPLLFESHQDQPLLSKKQAHDILQWCHATYGIGVSQSVDWKDVAKSTDAGAVALQELSSVLWNDILGVEREPQEQEVSCRFVSYLPEANNDNRQFEANRDLLPDGLHVDTNNNKHFRHWTILVYLDEPSDDDDEVGGATTFPLAIPLGGGQGADQSSSLVQARRLAHSLIHDHNVQHTRHIGASPLLQKMGREVDQAAAAKSGLLRILPRTGHVCVFSSIDAKTGYPHPLSFHGGEVVTKSPKNILTFFYEVSADSFDSRDSFAQQVQEREARFLAKHGCLETSLGRVGHR